MSFGILIFGIVISVIALLGTLIMAIISLATGKQRNGIIYGVAFIMSLVLAVLSITETAKRGADKVGDGIAWLKELDEKNKSYSDTYEEATYYAHIPEWNKDTVQAEFYYSYNNDDSTYYIPLVYPYRFTCNSPLLESGTLENFNGGKKNSCVEELKGITYFIFNDKMLLAKRDNSKLENSKSADQFDNSYLLFDFETGECKVYENEKLLEAAAEEKGYTGEKFRESFANHYWKYNDTQEYD